MVDPLAPTSGTFSRLILAVAVLACVWAAVVWAIAA